MTIDPKDLVRMNINEFKTGGVFYRLNKDGSYSRCQVFESELKDPEKAFLFRRITMHYHEQGRLFVNRNKPWKGFE